MSSIPVYSGEENLRRIKMQKATTFVVVEGVDDIPIYESCISAMVGDCNKYDIIHSGGKISIRDYVCENKTNNAIFLVDRDFSDIDVSDTRIVSLQKYSIENYFICEEVIAHALQFVLNCKLKDAIDIIDLNDFTENLEISLSTLIKVIYFYQKKISPELNGKERPAWSDSFLCKNDSWQLCEEKIRILISKLLLSPHTVNDAEKYFERNFSLSGKIEDIFPGKILKHSLHRYIKNYAKSIKPKAGGRFSDVENTKMLLSSVMHRSSKLKDILGPVAKFIQQREIIN